MEFDVTIIGASSSGLFVAEKLASSGLRVGVFERQKELNPARRTYIITPHLNHVFGGVPEALILHRIQTLSVETINKSVDIPLRQPDLVVERRQLIDHLAGTAKLAGAEIHYGFRFVGFETIGDAPPILLDGANGERLQVQTRVVIGADGVFSKVAEAARIKHPTAVPLMQAEIALPVGWDPSITKVWFDVDETRFFYWLIPESDERAVVGLIANERGDARQILDRFIGKYGFEVLAYQAGQAAMHQPRLQPWGQVRNLPVLLVGDAAGQVKVTTVGGTVSGFWGARAAFDAICRDTSYARELRPLKRELNLHWLIRTLLERLDNPGYDRLVECITPSVQDFLSLRNRDQMAGSFWQLPFREPRLLILGLQLLLKFWSKK